MEGAIGLVGLTFAAFAATSLDNLILLIGFASRPGQPRGAILRGALLAAIVVLSACLGAALLADFAPQRWVGYLGIVPIALGVRELARQSNLPSDEAPIQSQLQAHVEPREVAAVMLANSSDSMAALIPIFAETRNALLPLISGATLMLCAIACATAFAIAAHPRLGPPIQRIGPRVVPFVLIGVGLYVLWNTGTDTAR